tara:strand:+ start:247 stop:1341 length:1095 start_codon:yes stop_codon:yes gene_type:complete
MENWINPSKTIYTNDQFDKFKDTVLNRHIARKNISLGEIQIISDSVAKYAGLTFKLDDAAFKSLLRILGISKGLRSKLIKDFGANFFEKLIEIMSAKTQGNKSSIVMMVDVRKKTILNFLTSDIAMVSNQSYFKEIEHVIDQFGLQITDMHDRGNGFSISTLAPDSEWGLKGLKDEVFKFGLNFENDPVKGTRLAPFNQRLVCTNGMVTQDMLGATHLINTRDSWENFFSTVNGLDKIGYKPAEFAATVQGSMGQKASIAELEYARNLIKANSAFTDETLETYMPYRETELAYAKDNLDIHLFNPAQKKNARSAASYWDLINDITYISSNVSGMGVKNIDKIQMAAGRLLSKTPDTSNIVKSPF